MATSHRKKLSECEPRIREIFIATQSAMVGQVPQVRALAEQYAGKLGLKVVDPPAGLVLADGCSAHLSPEDITFFPYSADNKKFQEVTFMRAENNNPRILMCYAPAIVIMSYRSYMWEVPSASAFSQQSFDQFMREAGR